MANIIKQGIKNLLKVCGYEIRKKQQSDSDAALIDKLVDISEKDKEILNIIQGYTMTSCERQLALISAVRYVVKAHIPGIFVECGVWRGGSSMAIALTLLQEGVHDKDVYLFDTFSGMTAPSDVDVACDGVTASLKLHQEEAVWCRASRTDVEANMAATGYPMARIKFVEGPVEETISSDFPNHPIAVLRLDTDWYESTKHELVHLFHMVSTGGVIIVDDYGHWNGARAAVDEYLSLNNISCYMHRIDYTGRMIIKNC